MNILMMLYCFIFLNFVFPHLITLHLNQDNLYYPLFYPFFNKILRVLMPLISFLDYLLFYRLTLIKNLKIKTSFYPCLLQVTQAYVILGFKVFLPPFFQFIFPLAF